MFLHLMINMFYISIALSSIPRKDYVANYIIVGHLHIKYSVVAQTFCLIILIETIIFQLI